MSSDSGRVRGSDKDLTRRSIKQDCPSPSTLRRRISSCRPTPQEGEARRAGVEVGLEAWGVPSPTGAETDLTPSRWVRDNTGSVSPTRHSIARTSHFGADRGEGVTFGETPTTLLVPTTFLPRYFPSGGRRPAGRRRDPDVEDRAPRDPEEHLHGEVPGGRSHPSSEGIPRTRVPVKGPND